MVRDLFEPKLTEKQRDEIFKRALKGETVRALAAEYGVSTTLIGRIKYDKKRLEKAEKLTDARMRFLRLRVQNAAMKGVEKEHEILDIEVTDGAKQVGLLNIQHQVAASVMDRAGLKAVAATENRLNITFGGGDLDAGMPDEVVDLNKHDGEAPEDDAD